MGRDWKGCSNRYISLNHISIKALIEHSAVLVRESYGWEKIGGATAIDLV